MNACSIKYQIDAENGILSEEFSGELSIDEIGGYIRNVVMLPEYKYVTNIVTDIRNINIDIINQHDLDSMGYILNSRPPLRSQKQALIMDEENQGLLIRFLQHLFESQRFSLLKVKRFTSYHTAQGWIVA